MVYEQLSREDRNLIRFCEEWTEDSGCNPPDDPDWDTYNQLMKKLGITDPEPDPDPSFPWNLPNRVA